MDRVTSDAIAELQAWRRSLVGFKRNAKRDGNWLIDWRPWMNGERTHLSSVDGWLQEVKWLLTECKKRIAHGDETFFRALYVVKHGEKFGAQDDLDVHRPALALVARQRLAIRKANSAKALNQAERKRCEALCAKYWQTRKQPTRHGSKIAMLRDVAKRSGIPVRRVRSYLDELPIPYRNQSL